MESFNFFFGIELGHLVLNMTDNLSAVLQGSTVSVSEGQSIMRRSIIALEKIRSEESFALFWQKVEKTTARF